MSDRFFSPVPLAIGPAVLDGPEAHHLLHVMRAAVGDEVTLFDGHGAEFSAMVEKLSRASVELRVTERREIARELPFELTIGVALPKGDRQKWLVEKLTELGVTRLVPLCTERGVAQPTDTALERLERSVVEACKQCGRNRLMKIAEPQTWDAWISHVSYPLGTVPRSPITRLMAHPDGAPLSNLQLRTRQPTHLAIGPEGGLTAAEVVAASLDGWQRISLGPRILRVETAAVALAAAIALNS